MSRSEPEALPRSDFGPYEVLNSIGGGGMGIVYRARHRETGEEVALKVARRPTPEQMAELAKKMPGGLPPGIPGAGGMPSTMPGLPPSMPGGGPLLPGLGGKPPGLGAFPGFGKKK